MTEMKDFSAALAKLRENALAGGGILSVPQILAAFPEHELSEEEIRLIYVYLEENGIRLADYEPKDEGVPFSELASRALDEPESEEDRRLYEMYMDDLAAIPPIGAAEEKQLQRVLLEGTGAEREAAVNRLTEGNLRWVVRLARGFENNEIPLADLIQEGNLALFLALNEYAGEGDIEDFAEKRIRQGIRSYVREHNGQKKVQERMTDAANRILEEAKAYEEAEGTAMTAAQLSERLGIPESRVEEVLRESANAIRNASRE